MVLLGNPTKIQNYDKPVGLEENWSNLEIIPPTKQEEDSKKYIKPILIATALGGLFYVLKKKKII